MNEEITEEVTEAQLKKMAHDMVAAGNLNNLYGIEPFIKAQKLFEDNLHKFALQVNVQRPLEKAPKMTVKIGEDCIPDFLLKRS
jgi:hypothetical protein